MSKRLTDTTKWNRVWFRKLSPQNKCFWLYICDSCDHAGFWVVDFETAEYYIGCKLDRKELEEILKEHIKIVSSERWFIKDFIEFQYTSLKDKSRLHNSIIELLKKYRIPLSIPFLGDSKGVKAKAQEQVQVQEQAKAYDPIVAKEVHEYNKKVNKEKYNDTI